MSSLIYYDYCNHRCLLGILHYQQHANKTITITKKDHHNQHHNNLIHSWFHLEAALRGVLLVELGAAGETLCVRCWQDRASKLARLST